MIKLTSYEVTVYYEHRFSVNTANIFPKERILPETKINLRRVIKMIVSKLKQF